jgi:hypothetical protein
VSTQRLLFFACFLLACVLLAFYLIVFVYGDRLIDALAYLLGVDRSAFVFASLSAAPTLAPQTQSEKAAAYMAELVKPTPPPRGCPATFQDGLKNVPLPYEDIDKTEGAVTACGLRYQMFVLHAANWNLTRHVMEYMSAELPDSQLVLIDATINEETRLYRKEIEHFKIEVMYPRIPLSLAAGMEFIRRTAFSRGLDFVFYSHNDAQYTRSGIMKEALEGVCRFDKEHNNWGLLKFNYDIFCAYNMKAFKATGMWDPYIPNYKADFDYYRRMQCAGYTVISYDKPEPGISVLHKTSMTLKTLQQQSKEQQYGWWLTDEVGRYLYFWAKWNTDVRHSMCSLCMLTVLFMN